MLQIKVSQRFNRRKERKRVKFNFLKKERNKQRKYEKRGGDRGNNPTMKNSLFPLNRRSSNKKQNTTLLAG